MIDQDEVLQFIESVTSEPGQHCPSGINVTNF